MIMCIPGPMHEKVLVLFQESFTGTTIFLQLHHFVLNAFQEVHVGPILVHSMCNSAVLM